MRSISRLCLAVMVVMASGLGWAQGCNPTVVTSFTVKPGAMVGDGYQSAHGSYRISDSQSPSNGIELSGNPPFQCVPPSYPAQAGSLGNASGCVPIYGSAEMDFFAAATATTTYNMLVRVPYPYNSAQCPDPGMTQTLIVTAPPTAPPAVDGNTTEVVCEHCTPGGRAQATGPINLINGNTWVEQQDYALPGLGGGLEITRTWNSTWPIIIVWPGAASMDSSGMFGHSWRSSYEERLQTLTGGVTKYWRANGNAWFFTYDSVNGVYVLTDPKTARGTLSFNSGATQYTLTFKDGSQRIFNNGGRLLALRDRNGNQTSITLDGSNRITQVTDAAGRAINFDYLNASFPTLATALRDSAGTVASYTYDTAGRLTQVTYADSAAINYVYDADNLITTINDTNNAVLESHTYDGQRRGTMGSRANNVDKVNVYYYSNPARVYACNTFNWCQTYHSTRIGRQDYFAEADNAAFCSTCGGARGVVETYDGITGNLTEHSQMNRAPIYYTYTPRETSSKPCNSRMAPCKSSAASGTTPTTAWGRC